MLDEVFPLDKFFTPTLLLPRQKLYRNFFFLSFRAKREILILDKFNMLRFLTFVRNDISPYYDTVSQARQFTFYYSENICQEKFFIQAQPCPAFSKVYGDRFEICPHKLKKKKPRGVIHGAFLINLHVWGQISNLSP